MTGQLVLVTGVNGFMGNAVADELLDRGYRVRGTCRGDKAAQFTETVKVPGLEFVRIDDVATGDFTEALKGVDLVIHTASPLPGKSSVDDTLNTNIQGNLNVIQQAAAAGITKVVVTSTFGTVLDPSLSNGFAGLDITDSEWGQTSREKVLEKAKDPFFVYFASKLLAERALWEWAKDHPEMDIAAMLPAFCYGPFSKRLPYPSQKVLGTNSYVLALINGAAIKHPPPWSVDIRDVARAHVLALALPPAKNVEEKRFLICGGIYPWKEAAAHLNKTHPEYKTAKQEDFEPESATISTLNVSRSVNVLGLAYTPLAKTIEDAAASLVEATKTWAQ